MTLSELIADLIATFPEIKTRRRESTMGGADVWMIAGPSATLPDGLPIFCGCAGCNESGTHEDGVHTAFTQWLENRGFYLECEDGFWYVPEPLLTEAQLEEWRQKCKAIGAAPVCQDVCPF